MKRTEIYAIGSDKSLATYINDLDADVNLVYFHLLFNKMSGLFLSPCFDVSEWVEKLRIITSVSKDGNSIAYSESANLFAKQYVKSY